MSETFTPTEAQKAAAKPWAIGVSVSTFLGALSYALILLYVCLSKEKNDWIFFIWFCGTTITVDFCVYFCNKKMAKISDLNPPELKGRLIRWTLVPSVWALLLLLK